MLYALEESGGEYGLQTRCIGYGLVETPRSFAEKSNRFS